MRILKTTRVAGLLITVAAMHAQTRKGEVEWPYYGGDQGGSKYSALTGINTKNVSGLHQAWVWKTGETPLEKYGTRPGMFQNSPLMIDNVLYLSTPYNKVVALDAETGAAIWTYDPKAYEDGQPANGTGYVHRGVAAWRDGDKLRIFMNSRYRLICLDAKTGQPVPSFGDNGIVDTSHGLIWPINKLHYTQASPPVVYKDLVIIGNGVGDRLVYRNDPPGDVRAFDARTGKQAWSFHTIPQAGEFGNETWGEESWKFTGHTNVWAPMTLDENRGLLYLPVSTPSNDFFGGRRPGANLFGESLVCLDAATGKRKWHFQIVHHGLWDYDLSSPPTLATINVDGRKIDAVVQLTKEGFAFVFDRVTGKPVWPIEERAVPGSDVPGEHAYPTQPFPSKPPAFTPQGVSLDDAFDLTPELKAEAQSEMKKLRLGPLFTPPSYEGTLILPGMIGGANWGGGAFDPDTGLLYVKTSNVPHIARIKQPDRSSANPRAAEVDADWSGDLSGTNATFHHGIPLTKPPYAHLTAVDLSHGTIAWKRGFGDWPELRKNPALQDVKLPAVVGIAGPPGGIVTKGGLLFVGGEDVALHAIDKSNGKDLWMGPLPGRSYGTPITYRTKSGRQFVVVATGIGANAALVAFSLNTSTAASSNEALMNRRRFVHWLSTLPLWNLLGKRAVAQSTFSAAELATLREVAGVVLPSALGKTRIDAVVSGFVGWLGAYRPGAEMSTGYGFPRVQSLPGNPSAHYAAQLRELAPKLAAGKREAVAAALEESKVDRIPQRPDGKHIASDLMSYFYAGSDGQDLLYGVAIKRDDCRGLPNSGDRPPAWS